MPTAVLTAKGQITLPKQVRDALRLRRGDRVRFELRPDGTAEMMPETGDVLALFGVFRPLVRGVSVEAMNEAVARAGAGEDA